MKDPTTNDAVKERPQKSGGQRKQNKTATTYGGKTVFTKKDTWGATNDDTRRGLRDCVRTGRSRRVEDPCGGAVSRSLKKPDKTSPLRESEGLGGNLYRRWRRG